MLSTTNSRIKILIIIILLLGNITVSHAQYRYSLEGNLPFIYNGKILYLEVFDDYSAKKYRKTDSIQIKNGKFDFKGAIGKECERAFLYIKDKGKLTFMNGSDSFFMQFLIDTGENSVNVAKVDSNYYLNKLHNIKIKSPSIHGFYNSQDSLNAVFYNLYEIKDSKNSAFNYLPKDKTNQLNELMLNMIKRYPNDFYTLIYLRFEANLKRISEQQLLTAFNLLNNRLKNTPLGVELSTSLLSQINNRALVCIGKSVPQFTIETFSGEKFSNSELSGQPYLLVFSATWCGPCQRQLPKLIQLYNEYKSKGLKVIYFNLDDDVELWKAHINKNKLNWINVSERTKFGQSKIAAQFYTYAIPSCFLIDKTGKIVYSSFQQDRGLEQLDGYIKKTL